MPVESSPTEAGALPIEPSPEIEAVVGRWIRAQLTRDRSVLDTFFSGSEHLRYIGTAEAERWSGDLLRRGFSEHIAEVPDFTNECLESEAFQHGDVGWATWIGKVTFAGRPGVQIVRYSWVLVLEQGVWRIIQTHVSIPRGNLELFGSEHLAFDALIRAARAEVSSFGTEGTATIMFTDIAGSTRIAQSVGDRDWAVMMGAHLAAQAGAIEAEGGRVVKTLGDGTMASFPSARGALRAAMAMQAAPPVSSSEGSALGLRIGLHAGDVIQRDGDFFGNVVNKAARIAAIARPGEVLVTDAVRTMVEGHVGIAFDAPVEMALRGVEGRHLVSRLCLDR